VPSTGYDGPIGADAHRHRLQAAMGAKGAGDLEPLRVAIEVAAAGGISEEELQPASQLLQELEDSRSPLAFAHVPRPDMEELQTVTSRDAAVAILGRCLGFANDHGFQALILAEFHYHNFAFCQRSNFSAEKASTLISIFKTVHTKAIAEERLPEDTARTLFAALVDNHSQQLPPYRLGVFTREEAAAAKAYAERTFFRHYKMYAFAYVSTQELVVRSVFERVAEPVPAAVGFHISHEVDPRTMPDLQDLFMDPGAANSWRESTDLPVVPILEQYLRQGSPYSDEREANVAAAIEEAMHPHLTNLEPRLTKHPLTE